MLREFCDDDMPVLLVPADYPQPLEPGREQKRGYTEGGVRETTLGELFPDSFGPGELYPGSPEIDASEPVYGIISSSLINSV